MIHIHNHEPAPHGRLIFVFLSNHSGYFISRFQCNCYLIPINPCSLAAAKSSVIPSLNKLIVTEVNSCSASRDNWCIVGGDGGCRVGEVRAGTTSPMPDHKSFKLQLLVNFQKFSTLRVNFIYLLTGCFVKLSLHSSGLEGRASWLL